MKKSFGTKMKVWALGAMTVIAGSTFTACQDEIAETNRFTFTGELIADHLKNNEKYTNFCKILDKAKLSKNSSSMLTTLSTYGAYTCFAPTNEAVDRYIEMKYQEYIESVEANKLDPEVKIVNTGITSPNLDELTDSMATIIAKNHLIDQTSYSTMDILNEEYTLPKKTMNRNNVTIKTVEDKNSTTGYAYYIKDAEDIKISEVDIETENGYIHCLDEVINPFDKPTSSLLAMYPAALSLFNEALIATGFDERLTEYDVNPSYDGINKYGPYFETEKQSPPYPEYYYQRFTLLVETDELLADATKNSLGISINSLDSLEWFAANWYGEIIDHEKKTFKYQKDYKNPENPLYKYVAYHILDRALTHTSGAGSGGFVMKDYYTIYSDPKDPENYGKIRKDRYNSEENLPRQFDRYDYFETELAHTLIKVTLPSIENTDQYNAYGGESAYMKDQIVLNYSQEMGHFCENDSMALHINVVVEDQATTNRRPGLEKFSPSAINGYIYTLDKILIYNEDEMKNNVLNERMRWDVMSLFPELTNNDVRWMPQDNYTLVYIPDGYCERLKLNTDNTHVYYLKPYRVGLGNAIPEKKLGYTLGEDGKSEEIAGDGYANYQGDEMLVIGKYDFQYRIPYVPEGTYEIRFGFSCSDGRGVAQFYFGAKGKEQICGIPLDMRNSNIDFLGWFNEDGEENSDQNRKNDKSMRNRGFMKAPASIYGTYRTNYKSLRYAPTAMRRVLGTYDIDYDKAKEGYWIRFKDVTEKKEGGDQNQFNQDYLEIVPIGIVNNPAKPEDIY